MDRTVTAPRPTPGPIRIPPRPGCPPWCAPDACDVRYDDLDGWVGTHADALQMVTSDDLWWTVQLQLFVGPDGAGVPAIHLDTNATAADTLAADTAEELAAALLSGSLRLRAAARPIRVAA